MEKRRVVVTGAGMATSLGDNWEEMKQSLKALENKVVRMDEWDRYGAGMNTRLAAPYTNMTAKRLVQWGVCLALHFRQLMML